MGRVFRFKRAFPSPETRLTFGRLDDTLRINILPVRRRECRQPPLHQACVHRRGSCKDRRADIRPSSGTQSGHTAPLRVSRRTYDIPSTGATCIDGAPAPDIPVNVASDVFLIFPVEWGLRFQVLDGR